MEGTTFDNLAHFWSQGGELVDEQGKPIFGEEPTAHVHAERDELPQRDRGQRRVTPAGRDDQGLLEFEAAAQAQEVAMFQGGDFQYPPLKGTLPPEEFKKWEVSLLPTKSAMTRRCREAAGGP